MKKVTGMLYGTVALSGYLFVSSLANAIRHLGTTSSTLSFIVVLVYGACCLEAFRALKLDRVTILSLSLIGLIALNSLASIVAAVIRTAFGTVFLVSINTVFTGLFVCGYFIITFIIVLVTFRRQSVVDE